MKTPELRHRHSGPIAKHVPEKSPGMRPHQFESDKYSSRIATPTLSGNKSGYLPNRSNVKWMLLGFLLGVTFWHLVGFWTFIGDIMLKGHSNSSALMARIQMTEKPRYDEVKGIVRQKSNVQNELPTSRHTPSKAAVACTQLILDRNKRKTYATPCINQQPDLMTVSKPIKTASSKSRLNE